MATVKKMGEIGPDMFHLEGTGVGSSNNSGGDKEKKKLKSKETWVLFEINMGRIGILKSGFQETKSGIMKQSQKTPNGLRKQLNLEVFNSFFL